MLSVDLRREPGAGIGWDIPRGERAESEIDIFISRRHDQRVKDEAETRVEDLWKARERLEVAHRRRELDAEWRGWHQSRAAVYRRFAAEHEAAAERFAGEGAA
jgi:hypothetical protein